MSQEIFWTVFQTLVAIVLCVLIVCITYGIQATNGKILRADSCEKVLALSASGGTNASILVSLCAVKAARHD